MPLLKNIKQVRGYISVSATNNDTAVPMQRSAEQEFIIPVLGQALFDILQTEADTVPSTPSPLLDKTMYALAYLSYFKELPFIHTRITDTGLKNVVTDHQQTAYRYQYENLMEKCESEGMLALERLFEYLTENVGSFPDWSTSTAYARMNKNLIKTGVDFKQYYYLTQPYRTFYALQPIMQEVEDLYIIPAIGKEFFTELKAAVDPSTDLQAVLFCLKKAIANLTIHKACSKLSVKIGVDGFTVTLAPAPDRISNGENNAPEKQVMLLRQETERDGNNYLNMAKKYLNDNASISLFPTYFSSSLYSDPAATVTNVNNQMNGVFAL